MKKFFWAISIFLIIFAPTSLSAQTKADTLSTAFNEAVKLQDYILQLKGELVQPLDHPLHWKTSVKKDSLLLEKGGNVSVPYVLWYQVTLPKQGFAFFWATDGSLGKIFTPYGNFLLEKNPNGHWVLCLKEKTDLLNTESLNQVLLTLKDFKKQ